MKNKQSNIEIVKRLRSKFSVGKTYLIEMTNNKLSADNAIRLNLICIKKYKNYVLFDAIDRKGNKLYKTTLFYISDTYTFKEVKGL